MRKSVLDPGILSRRRGALVEKELNLLIRRCLWKPGRTPTAGLLSRAAAASLALKKLGMTVEREDAVVPILRGDNATTKAQPSRADPDASMP